MEGWVEAVENVQGDDDDDDDDDEDVCVCVCWHTSLLPLLLP
jgi:hypothetical protein